MGSAGETAQMAANKAITAWSNFAAAYATVMVAVQAAQRIWAETGQKFIDYSEQVKNLSRSIGSSAEEASRLIQVADDVRLSYDSMSTAMKIAQKQGIDVSIEGLAKLSDAYLALTPGVERAQFLLDKFGKSGMEMGKMMEKGGDEIRKMSDAIADNLILTKKEIDDAERYKRSLDDLGDAWDGLTMSIGKLMTKPVTQFLKFINLELKVLSGNLEDVTLSDAPDWLQRLTMTLAGVPPEMQAMIIAANNLIPENDQLGESAYETSEAVKQETMQLDLLASAAQITSDELAAISARNQELISTVESFASLNKSHADEMADAYDRIREAEEKLEEAMETKGKGRAEAIKEATEALNEQRAAIGELIVDYVQAGNTIVYEMIKAELAINGLTDEEALLAIEAGKAFGVMTDADVAMAQAAITQKNAFIDAARASGQLGQEVDAATNKIIFDMMMAKLAVDGLTDAEFQAALTIGKNLGVLSDAAIAAANEQQAAANTLLAEAGIPVDATAATVEAVDSVTTAIQTSDQAQDVLTTSVQTTTTAIQAEKFAVDNVVLSIQLATTQQGALTQEIWASVAAQNALNTAIATGGTAPTPPPSMDAGGIGRAGESYMIGTGAQPEMFTPGATGMFTPNAGGGKEINVVINNPVGETAETSIRRQLKNLSYLGVTA
jgi:hypothetical protein